MRSRRRKKNLKRIVLLLSLILLGVAAVLTAWLVSGPETPTDPTPDSGTTQITTSGTQWEDSSDTLSSTDTQTDTQTETQTDTETESTSSSESNLGNSSESDIASSTNPITDTTDVQKDTHTDTDVSPTDSNTDTEPDNTNTAKRIAFTFDDGPHAAYTTAIADEFAKYGGKCTFFVVGNRVHGGQAEAMRHAASLGHEIAIHGYTHTAYYNKCSDDTYQYELSRTDAVIYETIGARATLMRPIGGSITAARVETCPYSVILWNVDTKDWYYKKEKQENIDIIVNHVLQTVKDGDIILMHDIYSNTQNAVKVLLPLLKEQGYEFVTVSELIGNDLVPGKKYNKAP